MIEFTSLDDISRRKAELRAELDTHSRKILAIKKSLLSPDSSSASNKKGLSRFINKQNVITTAITAFDGARFAWKLYRRFKKK
ncbi:MAG: hypothetical protein HUK06_06065 [Bacteroidaceae bacterium]|nr:hypothetical protein [Bacteroidaceae bacterium]